MCPLSLSLSLSLSLPRCSLTMHSLAQQQWISQCGLTGEFEPTSEAVLHSVWVKKLFTLFTQSYDFLKNLAMEEPMFFGQFAEVRRMRSPMALTTAPASHRSRSLRPPCPIKDRLQELLALHPTNGRHLPKPSGIVASVLAQEDTPTANRRVFEPSRAASLRCHQGGMHSGARSCSAQASVPHTCLTLVGVVDLYHLE